MDLRCPYFLENMPIVKIKKVFSILLTEWWRNETAITNIQPYIADLVFRTKSDWSEQSIKYQQEYKCTRFDWHLTKTQKRNIEAKNKRLLQAVKSAKTKHERALKIQDAFDEYKAKYMN